MNHQFLGYLIKFYRTKKGISQEELCIDICTASYLSRIENGVISVDEEYYNLLLEKMGISLKKVLENTETLRVSLDSVYRDLIHQRNDSFEKINHSDSIIHNNKDFMLQHKIVSTKYYLNKNEIKLATDCIESIVPIIKSAEEKNLYMFYDVYLELCLKRNDKETGLKLIREIEKNSYFLNLRDDYENGRFYYNSTLILLKNYKYTEAKIFLEQSFFWFRFTYDISIHFNCLLLSGVIHNNLEDYDESERCYFACLRLMSKHESLNNPNNFRNIYLNMAFIYEKKLDFSKAQEYNLLSLSYGFYIPSILALIRCYYQESDFDKAKEYLSMLMQQSIKVDPIQKIQIDIFNFILYTPQDDITDLKKLEKKMFRILTLENLNSLKIYYVKVISNYYYNNKQYKPAYDLLKKYEKE